MPVHVLRSRPSNIPGLFQGIVGAAGGSNDGILEYFCYGLEFGSKYEPGDVKDESGNDITIDDLYEFLTCGVDIIKSINVNN